MPINFTQLFQDSWNFIRNQLQFIITFTVSFFLISLAIDMLGSALLEPIVTLPNKENLPPEQLLATILEKTDITLLFFINIISQILFIAVSSWGILTIHHISLRNNYTLSQVFGMTLSRLLGVLLLNILLLFPIIIGLANIWVALAGQTSPSIFAVLAMFFGIFVSIRLCLAPVSYLIGDKGLSESISFIWLKGVKRTTVLFLYCVLVYFIFQLVGQQLASLSDNLVFTLFANLVISFINAFALVFTYRFYIIFTQKAY